MCCVNIIKLLHSPLIIQSSAESSNERLLHVENKFPKATNLWECLESSPGQLVAKGEHYLCAIPSPQKSYYFAMAVKNFIAKCSLL